MKKVVNLCIILAFIGLLGVYMNNWIAPTQLYILSFLGLGYAFILIVFCIALIVAFFSNKKLFYIGLALFFIGIRMHLSYFSIAIPNDDVSEKKIKVLSYNVRLFGLYEDVKGARKQEIFQFLKEENADIYCFQEFYHQDPPTKFVTRDSLTKILGTPEVQEHYSFHLVGRQYYGVAMMTKLPVIAKGDVSFEDVLKQSNNYCVYMDVVPTPGDTLRVYNMHLQSIGLNSSDIEGLNTREEDLSKTKYRGVIHKLHIAFEKRQFQVEKIISHMRECPYRIIIMGDMNDTPMSYSYLQLRKVLQDAFTSNKTGLGSTYVGKLPVGRIDYILHSEELNPFDFQIQKSEFSDHRAISCWFNY
jgi:endonuclease/exonuclease/phosphatase family metal-dependent hydrolase